MSHLFNILLHLSNCHPAGLMKHEPALMTRALDLHNSVIRKARWTNFGYTIAQEGDSYSLVFYEAMDAVSFCLQVSYNNLLRAGVLYQAVRVVAAHQCVV